MAVWPKKQLYHILTTRRSAVKDGGTSAGIGEPALWHALIIIFLEFFSWGLLTVPVINVLAETFPTNKFLMNGFILGVKGLLSFLSAPLIGALSDIWGRKFFLILTVFSTCMPIPMLKISPWWYFALFSISGLFSATYSVVLAYVADITDKDERNSAYGLVSATFGASLVTSPALGAYLCENWNDEVVVTLATAVACLDVFFIMVAVPESLPAKLRHSWDRVTWETADPFATLRLVGEDFTVMLLCVVVFLSYLPEAGQFSCFFVYLKLVVGFSHEGVAAYIAIVGILSVVAQTIILMILHRSFGCKRTILFGLLFQLAQLIWYGFGSKYWMMWAAGILAALSQITYPSVSSYLSVHSDGDKQGTVQGIVTGIRGLCQGLGPALFGFIFYLFNVDLNSQDEDSPAPLIGPSFGGGGGGAGAAVQSRFRPTPANHWMHRGHVIGSVQLPSLLDNVTATAVVDSQSIWEAHQKRTIPGPPFVFAACLVACAIVVLHLLPSNPTSKFFRQHSSSHKSLLPSSSSGSKGHGGGSTATTRRFRATTGRTGALLTPLTANDGPDDDVIIGSCYDDVISRRDDVINRRDDVISRLDDVVGRRDDVIHHQYDDVINSDVDYDSPPSSSSSTFMEEALLQKYSPKKGGVFNDPPPLAAAGRIVDNYNTASTSLTLSSPSATPSAAPATTTTVYRSSRESIDHRSSTSV